MAFKICIQNLGKYDEGELLFKWIELPCTNQDFDEEIEAYSVSDGKTVVQFQDRQRLEYFVKGNQYCVTPKVSTSTWVRIWHNGELFAINSMPKYSARQFAISKLKEIGYAN